eukprot:Gb_29883 [translate_table: standard]
MNYVRIAFNYCISTTCSTSSSCSASVCKSSTCSWRLAVDNLDYISKGIEGASFAINTLCLRRCTCGRMLREISVTKVAFSVGGGTPNSAISLINVFNLDSTPHFPLGHDVLGGPTPTQALPPLWLTGGRTMSNVESLEGLVPAISWLHWKRGIWVMRGGEKRGGTTLIGFTNNRVVAEAVVALPRVVFSLELQIPLAWISSSFPYLSYLPFFEPQEERLLASQVCCSLEIAPCWGVVLLQNPFIAPGVKANLFRDDFEALEAIEDLGEDLSGVGLLLEELLHQSSSGKTLILATVKPYRGFSWPTVGVFSPSLSNPTLKLVYESSLLHCCDNDPLVTSICVGLYARQSPGHKLGCPFGSFMGDTVYYETIIFVLDFDFLTHRKKLLHDDFSAHRLCFLLEVGRMPARKVVGVLREIEVSWGAPCSSNVILTSPYLPEHLRTVFILPGTGSLPALINLSWPYAESFQEMSINGQENAGREERTKEREKEGVSLPSRMTIKLVLVIFHPLVEAGLTTNSRN